jgi:hypothetical protein
MGGSRVGTNASKSLLLEIRSNQILAAAPWTYLRRRPVLRSQPFNVWWRPDRQFPPPRAPVEMVREESAPVACRVLPPARSPWPVRPPRPRSKTIHPFSWLTCRRSCVTRLLLFTGGSVGVRSSLEIELAYLSWCNRCFRAAEGTLWSLAPI